MGTLLYPVATGLGEVACGTVSTLPDKAQTCSVLMQLLLKTLRAARLAVQLGREANMLVTHEGQAGRGDSVEGPLWPPGGPASRSLWQGIGLACLQVPAVQALLPLGGPAGADVMEAPWSRGAGMGAGRMGRVHSTRLLLFSLPTFDT